MAPQSTAPDASRAPEAGLASFSTADRAAVEPLAALVAVAVVGLALGLYAGALDDAAPDDSRAAAEAALDRAERATSVGGVVDPDRLRGVEEKLGTAVAVELEAGGERWLAASSPEAPGPADVRPRDAVVIAERRVTVRVAPGRNVRGTLRAVVWR